MLFARLQQFFLQHCFFFCSLSFLCTVSNTEVKCITSLECAIKLVDSSSSWLVDKFQSDFFQLISFAVFFLCKLVDTSSFSQLFFKIILLIYLFYSHFLIFWWLISIIVDDKVYQIFCITPTVTLKQQLNLYKLVCQKSTKEEKNTKEEATQDQLGKIKFFSFTYDCYSQISNLDLIPTSYNLPH